MVQAGVSSVLAAAALILAAMAAGDALAAVVLPSSVRPGDVFVLRPLPEPDAPASVSFLGRTYPPLAIPGERGAVFLLGVDLEATPGEEVVEVRRAGGREDRLPITVVKRSFPQERLSLPPAMVTPPRELEDRIAREQALAAEIYRTATREKLWDRGFSRALGQKAAGNFGRRRILNGVAKSPHTGQDYTAPSGTPVRAVAGGTVRLARELYYSGQTLLVDHGAGLVSQYMHLEKMLVAEGDPVSAGQVIGLVGSTGRATGPHLHLGIRLFEQRVDPETLWDLFPEKHR